MGAGRSENVGWYDKTSTRVLVSRMWCGTGGVVSGYMKGQGVLTAVLIVQTWEGGWCLSEWSHVPVCFVERQYSYTVQHYC